MLAGVRRAIQQIPPAHITVVDETSHADAEATGTAAPDMFRRSAVRIAPGNHGIEVTIDGQVFDKGRASGEGCNCLIDAFRQAIDAHIHCMANNSWVRRELLRRFPRTGESAVTMLSVLDFRRHWEDTVNLI